MLACVGAVESKLHHDHKVEESKGVLCSVCMEEVVAMDSKSQQRFGILPGCVRCLGHIPATVLPLSCYTAVPCLMGTLTPHVFIYAKMAPFGGGNPDVQHGNDGRCTGVVLGRGIHSAWRAYGNGDKHPHKVHPDGVRPHCSSSNQTGLLCRCARGVNAPMVTTDGSRDDDACVKQSLCVQANKCERAPFVVKLAISLCQVRIGLRIRKRRRTQWRNTSKDTAFSPM